MADQLRIGAQDQGTPDQGWFMPDDHLAQLLVDAEAVLRGVTAKIAAVRRHLEHRDGTDPEPDANLMRLALEHLADPDCWEGDRYCGARPVREIAATALGR